MCIFFCEKVCIICTKGGRAFSHLAPKLLPDTVRGSDTVSVLLWFFCFHFFLGCPSRGK